MEAPPKNRSAGASGAPQRGARLPEPSHPPSEPKPRRAVSVRADAEGDARPPRAQLVALLLLGFVLIAVPLYLWRRPRALPSAAAEPSQSEAALAVADASAAPADAGPVLVRLSDPLVLECHDPGPKKTAPEQCGHLAGFEKSFARAIETAATCVPQASRPATIVYVADVSYGRAKSRAIQLTLPKEGRTLKAPKVASACESSVAKDIKAAELDAEHGHSRYKVQITATYP